ncbi:MAG: hypothetical protein HRU70_00185 [Phycisphaeraceae bacterium]|nr:MAG: hypothetical protein HRU70_00185 [Phycisphaeraceae bacterium]
MRSSDSTCEPRSVGLAPRARREIGPARVIRAVMLLVFGWVALGMPTALGGGWELPQGSVPAGRKADKVAVIVIDREITRYTAVSVKRRLKEAAAMGADAVVIELDTPGGEVGAVLDICAEIHQSAVPNTVAWVNPKAYSGGAIIALACREIVVNEAARMGDALPIAIDPVRGLQAMPEAERQKIVAPLIVEVVDSARRRGWDESLVQAFVSLGVELWQVENTQTGQRFCIDAAEFEAVFGTPPPRHPDASPELVSARPISGSPGASPAPPAAGGGGGFRPASPALAGMAGDIEQAIDPSLATRRPVFNRSQRGQWNYVGYVTDGNGPIVLAGDSFKRYGFSSATVRNDAELTAFFGATTVTRLHQSWSETLAEFLSNILVRGVLIAIFLVALFTEMTHPGAVIPGGIAVLALLLIVAPPMIAGMAAWWTLAAILAGILLVVLEVLVIPGFGIPGIAGLILLFGGLVGTFIPGAPGDATSEQVLSGIVTVLLATVTAGFALFFLFKHLPSVPILNRYVLRDSGMEESDDPLLAAMDPSPDSLVVPGDEGFAATPLRPAGRAQIGDVIVDVVAAFGFLDQGTPVRVVSADRFRIVVDAAGLGPVSSRPATGPAPSGDGPAA